MSQFTNLLTKLNFLLELVAEWHHRVEASKAKSSEQRPVDYTVIVNRVEYRITIKRLN